MTTKIIIQLTTVTTYVK